MNLREENYLSKVGVEEILHYFKTPESHGDLPCFFHKKENKYEGYCLECKDLMRNLEEPLDWEEYPKRKSEKGL